MAARFIRLLASAAGEETFIRPEAIMAFGSSSGFPRTSWVMLWGADYRFEIRETCQEIATLLTSNGATNG